MPYDVIRAGDARSILGALLPPGVVAVEARGAVAPEPLFAEEEAYVARAVASRRLEFARGRTCARRALAELAIEPGPVPAEPDRAPRWPAGAIGSITHTRDVYCCAIAARAGTWTSLGVDAEQLRALEPGVQDKIVLPTEQRALARLASSIAWPCVVFSVKEAIFKASYPLDRRWLDFLDVEVQLDPARGAFSAFELANPARTFAGRFALDVELVISTLAM